MAYIDKYGVEYSDDKKTLVKCPKDFQGAYSILEGTTEIGETAFSGCSGLTLITIGGSVTTIGENAFGDCNSLTKTNYMGTIADWCKIQFDGGDANPIKYSHNFYIDNAEIKNLVIPEGVEAIGTCAFYKCTNLTSVTIGNSVTEIGLGAFSGCSGLTSITIPNSVIKIGGFVFSHCGSLTSVIIPNSVTTIGEYAFFGCSALTSITIGDSVTSIGRNAFGRCSSLQGIEIPQKIKYLHGGTFAYCENLLWMKLNGEVDLIHPLDLFGCQLPKEFQLVVPTDKLNYYKNSAFKTYRITDNLVSPNRTWKECVDQWEAQKQYYTSSETRLHKSIAELLNKGLVPSSFPPFGIELTVFEYKEFKKEGRDIKSIEGWCESGIYIHQCVRRRHNSGLDFFDENSNWMGERTPRKGFYKVISKSDDGKILNCYYNYKRGNAFLEEIVEINRKPFCNKASVGPKQDIIQVNDIIEVKDTDLVDIEYDGLPDKAYRIIWDFINHKNEPTEEYVEESFGSSYAEYGGYNDWDDDTIDSAFEGDPEATWNID